MERHTTFLCYLASLILVGFQLVFSPVVFGENGKTLSRSQANGSEPARPELGFGQVIPSEPAKTGKFRRSTQLPRLGQRRPRIEKVTRLVSAIRVSTADNPAQGGVAAPPLAPDPTAPSSVIYQVLGKLEATLVDRDNTRRPGAKHIIKHNKGDASLLSVTRSFQFTPNIPTFCRNVRHEHSARIFKDKYIYKLARNRLPLSAVHLNAMLAYPSKCLVNE